MDERLAGVLKERLLRSDGEQDENCCIKQRAESVADQTADTQPPDFDASCGSSHFPTHEGQLIAPTTPQGQENGSCLSHLLSPASPEDPLLELSPKAVVGPSGENSEYEWPFEILSHFPHEKAVSLMEHLQRTELQRAKASSLATKLADEVEKLEKELREANISSSRRSQTVSSDNWRRLFSCLSFLAVLIVASLAILAWFTQDAGPLFATVVARARSPLRALAVGIANDSHELCSLRPSLDDDELRLKLRACEAKLKVAAPSASIQNVSTDYDPDTLHQMLSDYDVMKEQLSRLWNDIDDAVHNGRNMVCWHLG